MTMNSIKAIVILLVVVSHSTLSTTNCEQTFRLLGFNWRASRVFWIAESLSGDCNSSRILQIILTDTANTTIHSYLRQLNDWQWIDSAIAHVETENPVMFQSQDGLRKNPN